MASLEKIEGVGAASAKKLQRAGIRTTQGLLSACSTPARRKEVAQKSGLSEKNILRCANMADLFRIKGVGEEYADLLEASGVDTVPELAQRNAANLREKMEQVNAKKKLVRQLPSAKQVASWVRQANSLPRAIKY